MTEATMEYLREDMAAGKLDRHQVNMAINEACSQFWVWRFRDDAKAWEYAQFAADMLRASLPERSEEGDIHCDCGKPKFRDAVACDKCLGKKSSLPEREGV